MNSKNISCLKRCREVVSILDQEIVRQFVRQALEEDRADDDITVKLVVPQELVTEAYIEARQEGVIAGVSVCRQVFIAADETLRVELNCRDGDHVKTGDRLMRIHGRAQGILRAERTALNALGWMSGIATLTAQFVEQVKGTQAVICDTRKTKPTLRMLSKYAVQAGGGRNHRMNLADGVLIKDNHLNVLKTAGKSLAETVSLAKKNAPRDIEVEVEVTSFEEALDAARSGADIILLDNMTPEEMGKVVKALGGQVKLEASGGITLENVAAVAATGVDYISIGALTHSAKNMDLSLEIAGF
jgi:nicotinate-nucleotide pyrophosphorylase (carboxylating)